MSRLAERLATNEDCACTYARCVFCVAFVRLERELQCARGALEAQARLVTLLLAVAEQHTSRSTALLASLVRQELFECM